MKTVNNKNYVDGTSMKTVQLYKKNNQDISYNDVDQIVQYMENQAQQRGQQIRVGIRALAIDQWKTLKSMDGQLISEDVYDDYFANRVANTNKFLSFNQIQMYVIK